jgi:hypothetical protein
MSLRLNGTFIGRLRLTKGAGHILHAREPYDYAATILAFISLGPMF